MAEYILHFGGLTGILQPRTVEEFDLIMLADLRGNGYGGVKRHRLWPDLSLELLKGGIDTCYEVHPYT